MTKFKLRNWHKILMVSCFILRILYVCLTLTQFGLVLFKFQNTSIINGISYFGAFFNAIFNLIIYILTAYLFRPYNPHPVKIDGTAVNREIQLLMFTFAILNIITIFASSIIIYLKQLPGFNTVSSIVSGSVGSNSIINNITNASNAATSHTAMTDDTVSSSTSNSGTSNKNGNASADTDSKNGSSAPDNSADAVLGM
jgi:hypothetical protein